MSQPPVLRHGLCLQIAFDVLVYKDVRHARGAMLGGCCKSGPIMRYKAFISYSHAADADLAATLQQGLQQFARPFWKIRACRVFRDNSDLSVSPSLWQSVENALHESEFFILLASPDAAQSPWVNKEVRYWCANRPVDTVLLVLTKGDLNTSSAVPEVLQQLIEAEPLYVDLRETRKSGDLSLKDLAFRDQVATLAATLRGVSKSELIGEDVRQRKMLRRFVFGISSALAILATVATVVGVIAWRQSRLALSRALAAQAMVEVKNDAASAVRLTFDALKASRTDQAIDALRQTLTEARIRAEFDSIRTNAGRNSSQCEHFVNNEVMSGPTRDLKVLSIDNGTVMRLVDRSGVVVGELRGHANMIDCLAFSPDGKFIVSVADDEAYVWDVNTRKATQILHSEPKEDWFRSAAWSPDGSFVVTGSISGATVWDPRTWRRRHFFEQNGGADHISVSPDSRLIATASSLEHYGVAQSFTASVFSMSSKRLAIEITEDRTIDDIRFSADGRFVVTNGDRIWRTSDAASVASWEHGGAEISSQFDQHTGAIEAGARDTGEGEITIHDVRFSMDGDLLAVIDRKEWVTIWHLASLEQLASLPLSGLPGPFTLSHDGTKLILRDGDRGRVLDLPNGGNEVTPVPSSVIAEAQVFMRSSSSSSVDKARQSPNGRFFIDRSSDGTTRIKDRQTGRAIASLGGSLNYPVEAAFSPDGLRIAVASSDSRVVRIHHWEEYAPEEELVELARHQLSR